MMTDEAVRWSLKAVALAIICAIIGYMLFVVAMFTLAIVQIAWFMFVVLAEGWPVG